MYSSLSDMTLVNYFIHQRDNREDMVYYAMWCIWEPCGAELT